LRFKREGSRFAVEDERYGCGEGGHGGFSGGG
jgi:hypothetical protein